LREGDSGDDSMVRGHGVGDGAGRGTSMTVKLSARKAATYSVTVSELETARVYRASTTQLNNAIITY